jgi:sugar O-acyltransferase (sialic acid O-acetyltransferase NeuD family)
MKGLIIIGAGKFGREVYAWAKQAREHGVEWRIRGFLDNRKQILDGYNYDTPVLDAPENYTPTSDDVFVCAVGVPQTKKQYCQMLMTRGAQFVNVIHPTVVMGENVKMGVGIILCPYVVVSCDAVLGNCVTVNLHVAIGHDVKIESYCQINPNVSLGGGAVLNEGVSVGSNATVLPDATVEAFAVVGAGSVVLRNVSARQTVFGVPARPVHLPSSAIDNEHR